MIKKKNREKQIVITCFGDVLCHGNLIVSGIRSDGSLNFDHLFKYCLSKNLDSDISQINMENIIGGNHLAVSGYPAFNGPPEIADSIVKAGFNLLTHATNHVLDRGELGLKNDLRFWEQHANTTKIIGVGTKPKSYENSILDIKGWKIGVLNYTYRINGQYLQDDSRYYVDLLNKDEIKKDVLSLKKTTDFIIVFPHWGTEYQHTIDDMQSEYAELFFKLGVNLVIGSHNHCIQPVEIIKNKEHSMLIYYGLGNYVSYPVKIPALVSCMARIVLEAKENKLCIYKYDAVPLITHLYPGKNMQVYELNNYTQKQANHNNIRFEGKKLDIVYEREKANRILGV